MTTEGKRDPRHQWGRVQATNKSDVNYVIGSAGAMAIKRAEKAAQARMAKLRTLKTRPLRKTLLQRILSAMFG